MLRMDGNTWWKYKQLKYLGSFWEEILNKLYMILGLQKKKKSIIHNIDSVRIQQELQLLFAVVAQCEL